MLKRWVVTALHTRRLCKGSAPGYKCLGNASTCRTHALKTRRAVTVRQDYNETKDSLAVRRLFGISNDKAEFLDGKVEYY